MAKVVVEQVDSQYIGASYSWWKVVLFSALLGCIWWGLALLLERVAIDPLVCRGADVEACGQSFVIAGNVAAILVAVLGVVGLVRLAVFRPLIVAGASLVVLWGLAGILTGLAWPEAVAWSALVYTLSYGVFSWITRLIHTLPMIVGVVVVVVSVHIVLAL